MTKLTTTKESMPVTADPDRFRAKLVARLPKSAAPTTWARIPGVLLLTATAAMAQTNYQWTKSTSGSWPIKGIAVTQTTPATVLIANGFNVYRSANSGGTWSTSAMPSGTFPGAALAFDPTNAAIAYGGRSHGMMKSTDGGINWFNLPNLNAGAGASAIVVDPSNTSIVYAGVSDGWGVYKSYNGGASWSNVLTSHAVQALAIDPLNTQIVFAGTKNYYSQSGGVLRSINGGQTWIPTWSNSQINSLAVNPVNPQITFAGSEASGLYKSINGGSWFTSTGGALANLPVASVLVNPNNPNLVYAATKGAGVHISSDAGATWTSVNSGLTDLNCSCMALHASSQTLFVGTYSGSVFVGVPQSSPSSATSFGVGCGSPPLALSPVVSSPPVINTTAQASLTNIPSSLAFVVLGWSNAAAGPFPLPLHLAGFGMPSCYMLQSTDVSGQPVPFTGPVTATYSLPVPNWAGLIGLHVYLQGWATAPGANDANIIVSNGVEWVIGTL